MHSRWIPRTRPEGNSATGYQGALLTVFLIVVPTVFSSGAAAQTLPGAPQNLSASAGNSQVSLSWNAPASNGGSTIGVYRVFRGSNSSNTLIVTSGGCANLGAVFSCTDAGLTNGQSYYYIVSAVNGVGQGPPSNGATATPTGPPQTPTISVSPTSLSFSAPQGGGLPLNQQVNVSNSGSGTLNWSASVTSGAAYIQLIQTNPQPNGGYFVVGPVTSALNPGTYNATIQVAANGATNTPLNFFVTYTVGPSQTPTISVSPTSLSFSAPQGGGLPLNQQVNVSNSGSGTLNWSASVTSGAAYIQLIQTNPQPNGGYFVVGPVTSALNPGTYNATIQVAANGATNTPLNFFVTYTIDPSQTPTISVSPTSLSFSGPQGAGLPLNQQVNVSNSGSGTLNWSASVTSGAAYIQLILMNPQSNGGYFVVGPVTSALNPGTYNATIQVAANGATNTPLNFFVTYTVSPAAAPLSITTIALSPPTATVGTGYGAQQAVTATGGTTPYSWSASSLPNGMGINASTGAVFGTPTVAGLFNFTVTVTDSSSPQQTASKVLSITVATANTLTITTAALNPPTATVGTGYGAQQAVTATGGTVPYSWSASGLPNGMGINSSTGAVFGTPTVAGTFNFTVAVTDSGSPQQTASKILSITVACTYSLSASSVSVGADAFNGSVQVIAPSGCSWTATSQTGSFATITSSSSGSGNGAVTYSVQANSGTGGRGTTLTIAGLPFTVNQLNGCVFGLTPSSASFASGSGTGSIVVGASGSTCPFTAASNTFWLDVNGSGIGLGSSTIAYSVQANSSNAGRTGTLTVAGQTFAVVQAGITACSYSLAQASQAFTATGGSGMASVEAPAGCFWPPTGSGVPWVTISSITASGNGTANYTVQTNPASSPRTGALTIAGLTYAVTQAGAAPLNCTASVPAPSQVAIEGRTEVLGDFILSCSGLSGPLIADISLTLNTNVTNALAGSTTDASLLVNEGNPRAGLISGYNTIDWPAVSLVAGNGGVATVRITNIRADASLLGVPSNLLSVPVTGVVSVNAAVIVPVTNASQTMGYAEPFLSFQKGPASPPGGGAQTTIPVRFQEASIAAFHAVGNTPATRLRLVVSNVPSTVQVFAPVFANEDTSRAQLYSGTDVNGLGGSPVAGVAYQQLTTVGGVATATWVVLSADPEQFETDTFTLLLQNATTQDLNQIQVSASFAPVSTVSVASPVSAGAPVPRYRDLSVTQHLVNLRATSTVLPPQGNTSSAEAAFYNHAKTKSRLTTAAVGSAATFTNQVTNDNQDTTATGVVVASKVTGGGIVTGCQSSAGNCGMSGNDVTVNLGTLPPMQSVTVTVFVTANPCTADPCYVQNDVNTVSDQPNADLSAGSASSTFIVNGSTNPPQPPPNGDLAQGKTATQSSTLPGTPPAGVAVDGNTDGSFFNGSVTATNADTNAWWQVDLGASTAIGSIVIWNRTDCCAARLNDYWVFISDTPFGSADSPSTLVFRAGTWSSHQTTAPNPSTTIAAGAQGRYVRVQLTGANNLSLAAVQVFGTGTPTSSNLAQGKTATQSSTILGYPNAGAGSAVDGSTDGSFFDGSVTATNAETNAWWQVDLGASAAIGSITIWNRTDCCGSRLSDYWVFVSDTPFGPTDTPATLQFRSGTWASHETLAPNPSASIAAATQGRYVRVQLTGTNNLSLAEVQVFGPGATVAPAASNLAQGKSAAQSSTLAGYAAASASSAVDGNTDGKFFNGSVSTTNPDTNSWWQVDLGASTALGSIVVWNRTDCCASRLGDYWVFVSDTPFGSADIPSTLQNRPGTWSSHQTTAPNPSATITASAQGRYLRVQLTGADYLSLAEVQVFAPATNLALGKAATQSSTLPGFAGASAASAVDGSTDGAFFDGSVTATNGDANAWWQVDLGASASVSSIAVWNRTDCCGSRLNDYWVFVSDSPFSPTDTPATLQFRTSTWASHQTTAPSPSATMAIGTQGRYVRVQLTGTNYLSLAEVQVFGQ